jgi:predicted transcriptional regulator
MVITSLYKKYIMGKYDKLVMEVINSRWNSTNRIVKLLSKKHHKVVSWHLVWRSLKRMEEKGKVECASDGKIFLWRIRRSQANIRQLRVQRA